MDTSLPIPLRVRIASSALASDRASGELPTPRSDTAGFRRRRGNAESSSAHDRQRRSSIGVRSKPRKKRSAAKRGRRVTAGCGRAPLSYRRVHGRRSQRLAREADGGDKSVRRRRQVGRAAGLKRLTHELERWRADPSTSVREHNKDERASTVVRTTRDRRDGAGCTGGLLHCCTSTEWSSITRRPRRPPKRRVPGRGSS
jgi:hypothetical protein